eukprot:8073829-Prorocentrum_lima.AAC.1
MTSSLVGSEMCIRDSLISLISSKSRRLVYFNSTEGPAHTTYLCNLLAVSYTHLTLPTICSV